MQSLVNRQKRLGVVAPGASQRAWFRTLACWPATVNAGRSSLLCFQPEAVPVSLATRTCQLPPARPCGTPTRLGHAINALSQPYGLECHSLRLTPAWVTEGRYPLRMKTYSKHIAAAMKQLPYFSVRNALLRWSVMQMRPEADRQLLHAHSSFRVRILFGGHPLKLERYRED